MDDGPDCQPEFLKGYCHDLLAVIKQLHNDAYKWAKVLKGRMTKDEYSRFLLDLVTRSSMELPPTTWD
jgi:hypothetical protein